MKRKESLNSILLNVFGSLLEKTINIKAFQRNLRHFLCSWLLFVFIITKSYKAVLLAFLSVPLMVGIQDISDLAKAAEQNSVNCYTYKGSALNKILIESDVDSWKLRGKYLNQNDKEDSFESDPYNKVFISPRNELKHYATEYFISEDSFFNVMCAFPASRKFCLLNILNISIH